MTPPNQPTPAPDLAGRLAEMTRENDALRVIAAKVMPCHYCGVKEIAECPHGFPGCALADDMQIGEMSLGECLRAERALLTDARAEVDAGQRFKTFVHAYLDQHGVPHGDPENPHQKEGCRIGARLDLMFVQRDAARDAEQSHEREVAALRAGLERALPAIERAALELGGTGYFASKADEIRTLLASTSGPVAPIEVHLNTRDCEPMQPETAEALGRILKAAHEQLSKPTPGPVACEGAKCQACRSELEVRSVMGTAGLCEKCVPGGFKLASQPGGAGE